MLGRFIDALSDEQRDRIVSGQEWRGFGEIIDEGQCLLQHIGASQHWAEVELPGKWRYRHRDVAYRFDDLCTRFGTSTVARACKLRAAATTSRKVEAQPAEATR